MALAWSDEALELEAGNNDGPAPPEGDLVEPTLEDLESDGVLRGDGEGSAAGGGGSGSGLAALTAASTAVQSKVCCGQPRVSIASCEITIDWSDVLQRGLSSETTGAW